jgi:hypothetical protein
VRADRARAAFGLRAPSWRLRAVRAPRFASAGMLGVCANQSRVNTPKACDKIRLEREARSRLADFREVARIHGAQARSFLEQILAGPMTFTPDGNRFVIEGEVRVPAALFPSMPKGVSPGGFEPPLAT